MQNIIKKIEERFKSGNSVPVERIQITRDEWRELRSLIVNETKESEKWEGFFNRVDNNSVVR